MGRVDKAVCQRATRLLQDERARVAPAWTSGLEGAVRSVNAEVEAVCASLLEDTQAASASAAAVRQRAVAGAEQHSAHAQLSPRVGDAIRAATRDPVDSAISHRATRLLQDERARVAPAWTSGLEGAVRSVNAEVEAVCASLLEDTQAASASAAAVRQRAVAGAEQRSTQNQLLARAATVAAAQPADGVLTGPTMVAPPALELLSDDSDNDGSDDAVEEAFQAMEDGTVLGLCGNEHISDLFFYLVRRPVVQGGHMVVWKPLTGSGDTARSRGGHVYLADVLAVLVDDKFCALQLESVYPNLPALSVQAYHFQDFQHWRVGLQALLHEQQASEPQVVYSDAIRSAHVHSWVVPLTGEDGIGNGADGVKQTQVDTPDNGLGA